MNQTGVNSANVTVATAYQLGRNPDFETLGRAAPVQPERLDVGGVGQ